MLAVFRWAFRRLKFGLSCRWLLIIFTFVWFTCLFYLIALLFEETEPPVTKITSIANQNEFIDQKGVHVIIGQYVGSNLISDSSYNLTKDILNSNYYNPVEGQGENGLPVYITELESQKAKLLYQINRFNLVASDKISINRTLPDARKQKCKVFPYNLSELSRTSIIIVFHNEAWSTLLRTIHSVINRSPHQLLAEIILVDDASERLFLQEPLQNYIDRLQDESKITIKIVRSPTRIGLVQARLLGTRHSSAPILTYLDAHVEATTGWLPPLLHRLHERPETIISPVIDVIHEQTFAYARSVDLHWGAVNWAMHFRWFAIGKDQIVRNRLINQLYVHRHMHEPSDLKMAPNLSTNAFEQWLDELEHNQTILDIEPPIDTLNVADGLVRPFKSPVMAGGLFSIHRHYFERIGTYDAQMLVWGGENIELSLRVWSCGGRVETHPCSHVAHVFRRSSPYIFPGGVSHVLYSNLARVLHVWMEPRYQLFFYLINESLRKFYLEGHPSHVDVIDMLNQNQFAQLYQLFTNHTWLKSKLPNLDQRIMIKNQHKCNGFDWFLRQVWPQSFFPVADRFFGQLRTSGGKCAQIPSAEVSKSVGHLQVLDCDHQAYQPQLFAQGQRGTIETDESLCIDVQAKDRARPGTVLVLLPCSDHIRQRWIVKHKRLQHVQSRLCVRATPTQLQLYTCPGQHTKNQVYPEPAKWWIWASQMDRKSTNGS